MNVLKEIFSHRPKGEVKTECFDDAGQIIERTLDRLKVIPEFCAEYTAAKLGNIQPSLNEQFDVTFISNDRKYGAKYTNKPADDPLFHTREESLTLTAYSYSEIEDAEENDRPEPIDWRITAGTTWFKDKKKKVVVREDIQVDDNIEQKHMLSEIYLKGKKYYLKLNSYGMSNTIFNAFHILNRLHLPK